MAKPINGRFANPQSLFQLSRHRGMDSEMVGFLLPFARQDFCYVEDDFDSDTISSVLWGLGADGTATTFAAGALESGTVQGSTGTTDNGGHMIFHDRTIWSSGRNCGAEIRFKVDIIASNGVQIEFGFSDPLSDNTLPAIDNIDTPASSTDNGQTDTAVLHIDGDATLKTWALVGGPSIAGTTKANMPTGALLTAATYSRLLVQLNTNLAMGVMDNDFTSKAVTLDNGPDAAVLLRPHYFIMTLNTTAHVTDLDYFRIWSERA
jgi:hypothetical protein